MFGWQNRQILTQAANQRSKQGKGVYVYSTLRATAERSQQELQAYLDTLGIQYQSFYIANKLFVEQGSELLALTLAARPDVEKITVNHQYQLPKPIIELKPALRSAGVEPNLSFIRADQVWALGVDGTGVVLAGNDTGLQWDHPAIKAHYRGWSGSSANHNYSWWDATGTFPLAPADDGGHGTHTTGTMVGDDGAGNKVGVAPGAKTIHCKNMTGEGDGNDLTFTTCFQWDLAPWDLNGNNPRPDLAPDAVNNSWGYWGGGFPGFEDEINALQAAGIVVEISAGNEGPACSTLRSPGDHEQVLTTGSVSYATGALPGTISGFSSRGPSQLDPLGFFPDVMAPGEDIRSSVPGGGYEGGWSGTSMAGPHVTGLIGLLWSANPGLRGMVEETYDLIRDTAVPLTGQSAAACGGDYVTGPNNDWGAGTIDALAAVEAAFAFGDSGTISGVVVNAVNGLPVPGAKVEFSNATWSVAAYTTATGAFTRRLPIGVYTAKVALYGFLPAVVAGVVVVKDGVTTQNFDLTPARTYVVAGIVSDRQTGWPLYAAIEIDGYPGGRVWTDPVTGRYQRRTRGWHRFHLSCQSLGRRLSVGSACGWPVDSQSNREFRPGGRCCYLHGARLHAELQYDQYAGFRGQRRCLHGQWLTPHGLMERRQVAPALPTRASTCGQPTLRAPISTMKMARSLPRC